MIFVLKTFPRVPENWHLFDTVNYIYYIAMYEIVGVKKSRIFSKI